MRIRNAKDFWAGVMFVAFGLFFAGFAGQYDMGTAARMGPAYFPTVLGGLLAVLGAFISVRSCARSAESETVGAFHFKPLLLVLGAVVVFGALLQKAGLFVALILMIVIASFGSGEFRWREVIPLAIFLALLSLAIFIYALGLTIPAMPAFMER